MSSGGKMSMPMAQLLKSAICKTNTKFRPSPSMFYFPGLTSAPLWSNSHIDPSKTNIPSYSLKKIKAVEDLFDNHHQIILEEYKALRAKLRQSGTSSDFDTSKDKDEHKLHNGKWEWNSYILKGKKQAIFEASCPVTVKILESMKSPKLMTNTPFSFAFFSTLSGDSKIAPHCSPCNLRLRCHIPLYVPEGDLGIRIANQTVEWKVGQPLIFDDCYEHEVWNLTGSERIVLLFDIWHPDLSVEEIIGIENMFGFASEQGWLK